jgi:C4-dicarboxylate-specific signal transduction histidine kinase
VEQKRRERFGVVTDSRANVLPGVAVEASSAALLDKVRTATTNAQGEYRIVELHQDVHGDIHTYGFAVLRREGIELTSNFNAVINAELRIGGLHERLAASGSRPPGGRGQLDDALGRLRSELPQLARVTTLGAMTASFAHEANQPLAGIITNASTCFADARTRSA